MCESVTVSELSGFCVCECESVCMFVCFCVLCVSVGL